MAGMLHHDIPLSAAAIVSALGGPTALSRRTEIPAQRSAIANWPTDGIPGKYWPALARIASEKAETAYITIEQLERHTHPARDGALDPPNPQASAA